MTLTYELTCTDCSFSTVVEGDTDDVLRVADAHQSETGTQHFVNVDAQL